MSKHIEASRDALAFALQEIEKQKEQFAVLKEEAEISQQIKSMNQSQVEAVNSTLEKALAIQEKRSSKKSLLWNTFFCILSAVLGFILGKLF